MPNRSIAAAVAASLSGASRPLGALPLDLSRATKQVPKVVGDGGKILGLVDEPQVGPDPPRGRPHQISAPDRPDYLLDFGIGCERPDRE
jgi:hypothetical protein